MRILLISQMWPSRRTPEFGAFLPPQVAALRALGHRVEVVAISGAGGSRAKHLRLAARAAAAARRLRPDVVLAHMLLPAGAAGLLAARVGRCGLVVMAHGQDVENLADPVLRRATSLVTARAAAVIASSRWLADKIEAHLSNVRCELADLGVDIEHFRPGAAAAATWPDRTPGPRLLCVGSLDERKNVVRLADAFAALATGGSLVFVGGGKYAELLAAREHVHVVNPVPHHEIRAWLEACDVLCQPSLREPFGIAALEAMAVGRAVLVTAIGGPAEFVPTDAGAVVDPLDTEAIVAGLRRALTLDRPNAAAIAAAAEHSTLTQAARVATILQRALPSGNVGTTTVP